MREKDEALYELEVDAQGAGDRIDRWLASMLPDISRTRARALLEAGCVAGDEGPVTDPARRVTAGQRYEVAVPPVAPATPAPQSIPLDIIFEDRHIIVVDKAAGMVVHPAPGSTEATLVNALLAHCGESLSRIGGVHRPGIVHRLDKDTSGLLVVAKTDQAHASLAAQLSSRTITRLYRAVVWGVPMPRAGRIEGNIGRSPHDRKRMAVLRSSGRPARTHFRVLRTFGDAAAELECRLDTGRTHQIRVHLGSRGHPLVGDRTYGRITAGRRNAVADTRRRALTFPRQALHAAVLSFDHPADGRPLSFESEMPEDIKELISDLATLQGDRRNHVI